MKRLTVYCEGQTEEMVVQRVLRPHLHLHGVQEVRPVLAANSLKPEGRRGGFVNWEAIEFDLRQIFVDSSDGDHRFTTLLDVFRMPRKTLELAGLTVAASAVPDVERIERAIEAVFGEPRFTAYLQRHELEALLLADMDALERVFRGSSVAINRLREDIAGFASAEEINHGDTTHPAARIEAAIPGYCNLKASNAFFVLQEAGLGAVRSRCPRFDEWLRRWETWGGI